MNKIKDLLRQEKSKRLEELEKDQNYLDNAKKISALKNEQNILETQLNLVKDSKISEFANISNNPNYIAKRLSEIETGIKTLDPKISEWKKQKQDLETRKFPTLDQLIQEVDNSKHDVCYVDGLLMAKFINYCSTKLKEELALDFYPNIWADMFSGKSFNIESYKDYKDFEKIKKTLVSIKKSFIDSFFFSIIEKKLENTLINYNDKRKNEIKDVNNLAQELELQKEIAEIYKSYQNQNYQPTNLFSNNELFDNILNYVQDAYKKIGYYHPGQDFINKLHYPHGKLPGIDKSNTDLIGECFDDGIFRDLIGLNDEYKIDISKAKIVPGYIRNEVEKFFEQVEIEKPTDHDQHNHEIIPGKEEENIENKKRKFDGDNEDIEGLKKAKSEPVEALLHG